MTPELRELLKRWSNEPAGSPAAMQRAFDTCQAIVDRMEKISCVELPPLPEKPFVLEESAASPAASSAGADGTDGCSPTSDDQSQSGTRSACDADSALTATERDTAKATTPNPPPGVPEWCEKGVTTTEAHIYFAGAGRMQHFADLDNIATVINSGLAALRSYYEARIQKHTDTIRNREAEYLAACQEIDEQAAEIRSLTAHCEQLQKNAVIWHNGKEPPYDNRLVLGKWNTFIRPVWYCHRQHAWIDDNKTGTFTTPLFWMDIPTLPE
jgi:hypothetical protein